MNRGRPSEQVEVKDKYVETYYETRSKPEIGWVSKWHYDKSKNEYGPFKTEHFLPKGYKHPKFKVDKRTYGKHPVVMVFKTSNRSNAKTKMKIFNQNIDYVITSKKLPGVPETAEILELAVGNSFIERYQQKYNLN
jgi:hypothetical protein